MGILTKTVLKFAARVPDIEKYQRYLFVGPHPDDIEIGAGASAARLVEMGKDVSFLICMDGRFGDGKISSKISREELVEIRREEAVKSAAVLGVKDVRFLDLSDGGLYSQDELLEKIFEIVGRVKPDVIFAPDPCVSSECHTDHLNTGEAVRRVAYFAPYSGIAAAHNAESSDVKAIAFYMTAKANSVIKVTAKQFAKQLKAIFECHISQFPHGDAEARAIGLYLKLRSLECGIRCMSRHGECFRVLGTIHMHCLPEAGN